MTRAVLKNHIQNQNIRSSGADGRYRTVHERKIDLGKSSNVEKMILTALMIALIAVATAIYIPIPNGYIHPGDSMIFLAVLLLGWKRGAVAAGVGSAFTDLFLGFVVWAPWTLLIKGGMALLVGLLIQTCVERRRGLLISCAAIVAIWLLFNAAVHSIVLYETARNASALAGAIGETVGPGAAASLLRSIQMRLMFAALLIPAAFLVITFLLKKKENIVVPPEHVVGMTGGGLFMVLGYYVAGGLIYGNFAASAFSIPANMLQFVGGFLIASLVSAALQKTSFRKYLVYSASSKRKKREHP
jgi:uncharacterized membrane protein